MKWIQRHSRGSKTLTSANRRRPILFVAIEIRREIIFSLFALMTIAECSSKLAHTAAFVFPICAHLYMKMDHKNNLVVSSNYKIGSN